MWLKKWTGHKRSSNMIAFAAYTSYLKGSIKCGLLLLWVRLKVSCISWLCCAWNNVCVHVCKTTNWQFVIIWNCIYIVVINFGRRNWPPDWAWFLPRFFSPFSSHRWSFGSLPLSPLDCLVGDTSFPAKLSTWLPSLNSIIKCLQLKIECLILSFYIIDTLFSYFDIMQLLWHNLYC